MWDSIYIKQLLLKQLEASEFAWKHESQTNKLLYIDTTIKRISNGLTLAFLVLGTIATALDAVDTIPVLIIGAVLVGSLRYAQKFKDDSGILQDAELHRTQYEEYNKLIGEIKQKTENPDAQRGSAQDFIVYITHQLDMSKLKTSRLHISPEVIEEWEKIVDQKGIKRVNIINDMLHINQQIDDIEEKMSPRTITEPPHRAITTHNTTKPVNPAQSTIARPHRIDNDRRKFELARLFRGVNDNSISEV